MPQSHAANKKRGSEDSNHPQSLATFKTTSKQRPRGGLTPPPQAFLRHICMRKIRVFFHLLALANPDRYFNAQSLARSSDLSSRRFTAFAETCGYTSASERPRFGSAFSGTSIAATVSIVSIRTRSISSAYSCGVSQIRESCTCSTSFECG